MESKESTEMHAKLRKSLLTQQITKLQFDVYNQLINIPPGRVTTYKELAKAVKCNSARAIGQVLRRNPFAPEVPCHRVVRSDLTLGGFGGSVANKTVEKKMKILQKEGVEFTGTKDDQCECSQVKVNKESVWTFANISEL